MTRRLVVITEIIAPYRIPVFNALAARPDLDLHVIFLARTDATTRQWHVYENEIRFAYSVLPSWRKRIGKHNLLLNSSIDSALVAAAPEAIICGGYNYIAAWRALSWARQNQVPFFLWCESTARDDRHKYLPVEWLKEKFFRSCDGFVVPGRSAAEYVRQFAQTGQPIFAAPNAVDVDLFAAYCAHCARTPQMRSKLCLPPRYFLYAGRLVRSKGVADLVGAYQQLPARLRSEIGLVIAGDGPLRTELEMAAREIWPGTVQFTGFLQRDALAVHYALAECLVMPTRSDPWGLVVNEAMACGLPIICTKVAGCAADLVRDNGILVEPGNLEELAGAMETVARDPELRRSMSWESTALIRDYLPEACAAGIAQASLWKGMPLNA